MNPTNTERFFDRDDLIVSKTDVKGRITYANKIFLDIAGYTEAEVLGKPHSMIRHPDMPRCVFKLLWDTLEAKKELFAYVKNMTKNGDYYWVFAHVTPSFNAEGRVMGYHSNRRVPDRDILRETIIPLYQSLRQEEERHPNRKDGMLSAYNQLVDLLKSKGMGYDQFIFSLKK